MYLKLYFSIHQYQESLDFLPPSFPSLLYISVSISCAFYRLHDYKSVILQTSLVLLQLNSENLRLRHSVCHIKVMSILFISEPGRASEESLLHVTELLQLERENLKVPKHSLFYTLFI